MEHTTAHSEYETVRLDRMKKAAETAEKAVVEMAAEGWDLQETIEQAGTTTALVFKRPT